MIGRIGGLLFSFFLSSSLWAGSGDVVADYAFAQKCYHTLDKTTAAGWDHCIRKFENIVKKYPGSDYARKALFSTARLSQEGLDLSREEKDLERAIKGYNQFLRDYPKDSMADDALFQIAKLRLERQKDKEKGMRALEALLERYPGSDRVKEATRYLNAIRSGDLVQEPMSRGVLQTVVIDPGHGGSDPGAKGALGTREAEVSLQIARKLALQIKKQFGAQVYLTRTNNQEVSLDARNRFADQKGADLFISIHANAHPQREVGGVQTFYLNNATSEAGRRLAARENKVAGKILSLEEKILSTMLQNADAVESRDLARAVQTALVRRLRKSYAGVQDLRVDGALFYVLVGAKCPSVLVETSFITNPKEERRLRDTQYQWALAEGIVQGIQKYSDARRHLASSL